MTGEQIERAARTVLPPGPAIPGGSWSGWKPVWPNYWVYPGLVNELVVGVYRDRVLIDPATLEANIENDEALRNVARAGYDVAIMCLNEALPEMIGALLE